MISVIIPVYNTAPYLNRCVQSVIDQLYQDWECILVDDGSTDDSGRLNLIIFHWFQQGTFIILKMEQLSIIKLIRR